MALFSLYSCLYAEKLHKYKHIVRSLVEIHSFSQYVVYTNPKGEAAAEK